MAVTPGTPSSAEAATDNLLTGIQTPVKDEQTLMTVSVLMPTSDDTIVPLSGCFSPAILRKMTKTSTAPPISIPHSHPVKAHSGKEAIVVLAENPYYESLESAMKIRKYVKQRNVAQLPKTVQDIIRNYQDEANKYEVDAAEELKKDFEESIDNYLAHCKENGKEPEKPFSGKTVLRMPSELHQQAAAKARSIGISLNEFINRAISAAVL